MINAQVSSCADSKPAAQVRHLSQRGFWLLFVMEGLLIAGILLLVLHLLVPAQAPLAQTGDYATVRAAIQARLNGAVDDPLVEVAPGVKLVTTPGFPAQYKAEAEAGGAFLDLLREEKDLNWTFISPSALFIEGERTGKFRLGTDQLLADANGKSWISFADYAIALADEIERPAHPRQRFTVGY